MADRSFRRRPPVPGFGMVELMVGLVVGMVVVLIIAQSYSAFESQKRTSTGGSDAQDSGLMALHLLQTDARMAGLGLATSAGLACSTMNFYNDAMAPAAQMGVPVMPVQIIEGGAGPNSSDTVIMTYSSAATGGVPAALVTSASNSASALTVQAPAGVYNIGDLLLVAQPGSGLPCARIQVAAVQIVAGGLQITPGASGGPPTLGPPASANLFTTTYGPSPQSYVYNMGQMVSNQYQVSCTALTVFDRVRGGALPAPACASAGAFANNVVPLADGIVDIQAQYGIAQAGSQSVTCWVDAVNLAADPLCPAGAGNWATPAFASVSRIKAVHIAVVARSAKIERGAVTNPCRNTNGGIGSGNLNNGPCAWPDTAASPAPIIDLSADPNWQRYRYKVYETVIPIRNVLWANL